MIEVLVTMMILAVGLLGVAGLQTRLQMSEMEAYQRAQAMILVEDMANRIAANRHLASTYVTTSPIGTGSTCSTTADANLKAMDQREWCQALKGAGEKSGTSNVGTMIGGRGCVEVVSTNEYMVTVAWQGLGPLAPPPDGVACGADQYDTENTPCVNDRCRRTVTTIIQIKPL